MTFPASRFFRQLFFAPDPIIRNDDSTWEPGDIAECIAGGTWYSLTAAAFHTNGPKVGDRIKVENVEICDVPTPKLFLTFKPYKKRNFRASCFRKVVPQADAHDAADAEFVDLLRPQPVHLPPVPARELEEAARWSA